MDLYFVPRLVHYFDQLTQILHVKMGWGERSTEKARVRMMAYHEISRRGHAQSTCAEPPRSSPINDERSVHCPSKLTEDYTEMSKKAFQKGLAYYQIGDFQTALGEINQVREAGDYVAMLIFFFLGHRPGGDDNYIILYLRAAVLMKLGKTKAALQDAKRTIDLASERWQGYARAARVFLVMQSYDASLKMVSLAMGKLKGEDTQRQTSLLSLKADVQKAQGDLENIANASRITWKNFQ